MKMQSAGKHAKRIVDHDGAIVGFAMELANGRWAPFDERERKLVEVGISFASAADVFTFFKMIANDASKGGDA